MFGNDFLSRHLGRQPLDADFNAMTMTMALKALPMGWHPEDSYVKAPHDLPSLNVAVNSSVSLPVWAGAAENQVYACPEHLYAARAWHDATHYRMQLPFNVAGEAGVTYVQAWSMLQQYGHDEHTQRWVELLVIEIIGNALEKTKYGEFPADPRSYAERMLDDGEYRLLAAAICVELADENATELDAVRLAAETWGKA